MPDNRKRKTVSGCDGCPGMCCHDMVMPILKPRTIEDVEELKWQVQYDTVRVFIANKRWHLIVAGRCQYLDDENWCMRYDTRPDKCRDHNPPDCEFYDSYFEVMLETPEDVQAYFDKEKKVRAARRKKARAAQRSNPSA